jgi:hypothetical protein
VIADDGSGPETARLVEIYARKHFPNLHHVWHEDCGFRKTEILNKATVAADGDYLIFTDGDCIPRRDFVAAHRKHARPNWYLSGGSHIDIPEPVHQAFVQDDVKHQRMFNPDWLTDAGMDALRYRHRLTRSCRWARLLDALTPRSGVFIGCNSSAWKRDVLAVNGFNEQISYGSEDKELGARMTNLGVRSRRLKFTLVCVHLGHARSYADPAVMLKNKQRLRTVRQQRITAIPSEIGIKASGEERGASRRKAG